MVVMTPLQFIESGRRTGTVPRESLRLTDSVVNRTRALYDRQWIEDTRSRYGLLPRHGVSHVCLHLMRKTSAEPIVVRQ